MTPKPNEQPIRLMLLDDHEFILHGMSRILSQQADMKVLRTFLKSHQLMAALKNEEPDIVVVDYSLGPGEVDGLNLIRALRNRHPHIKVLVISSLHTPATVALALRCGARGFVGKELDAEQLVIGIRRVFEGRIYLDPDMEIQLSRNNVSVLPLPDNQDDPDERVAPLISTGSLTIREREVLRCCLDGQSVTQIAAKFSRSIKTISAQKQSAYRKLGLRTDNELFKIRSQLEGW